MAKTQEKRLSRIGILYAIVRNDDPKVQKVIYHHHCSSFYTYEMTVEQWDALPDPEKG